MAATLCLAGPVLADDSANGGGLVLPTFEYAVPGTFRANDEAGAGEQKVPQPMPSGCPFNDGELELIV